MQDPFSSFFSWHNLPKPPLSKYHNNVNICHSMVCGVRRDLNPAELRANYIGQWATPKVNSKEGVAAFKKSSYKRGSTFENCQVPYMVRAVATALEKTPTKKVKFSELRDHHQSIPRQNLLLGKVAIPHLHGASAIRRRRRPDAWNVILRLNRCLDGMR